MEILTMADVDRSYILNQMVYLGKLRNIPERDQGRRAVMDLTCCLENGHGAKADNFFTSLLKPEDLLHCNITLCGHKKKKQE
jgi:hypothetical protein